MIEALAPMSLPSRPDGGHKGTFGTIVVVGGQCGRGSVMLGSPVLAALGALRCGAGRVVLAMPEPLLNQALSLVPSATGCSLQVDDDGVIDAASAIPRLAAVVEDVQAIAVGPGLGRDEAARDVVASLLAGEGAPLVVDADGLNAIADRPSMLTQSRRLCVFTPHPGEYSRLAAALGLPSYSPDEASRGQAAASLARCVAGVAALKGPGTVVSDGERNWTCASGSVVLAVPGSGDVLTGVVASLLGQHRSADPAALVALAVRLHARAGLQWQERHGDAGMLATELADELPMTLLHHRE